MDSLLANYASDDEEQAQPQPLKRRIEDQHSAEGMFSSLPPPKGLFSSLPPPKKARVQFSPPIDLSILSEKEVKKPKVVEKQVTQIGGLVLPAPKNAGSGQVLGGGDRRLGIMETEQSTELTNYPEQQYDYQEQQYGQYQEQQYGEQQYGQYQEQQYGQYQEQQYGQYEEQAYVDAGQAEYYHQEPGVSNGTYVGPSNNVPHEEPGTPEEQDNEAMSSRRSYGAREFPVESGRPADDAFARDLKKDRRKGKNEAVNFIEIKQADLTANRPREDQLRMTGIAFGTTFDKKEELEENKPSKLHKRKHQIGSLYYDMRQKEIELFERRAQGQLSKAQTRAKYGW